jgi:hypothetical protein
MLVRIFNAACARQFFERSIDRRWKENAPKIWGWRRELNGNEGPFVAHLRRTHDPSFDLALRFGIFDSDHGAFAEAFWKNQHGAAGTDGMRVAFVRVRFAGDLHNNSNPQQHALSTAPLFRRGRTRGNNPARGLGRLSVWLRFYHSSSPQKSISGATSSTPYSQPSGRGTPRQTTTAALLVSVARFVSARRCSS